MRSIPDTRIYVKQEDVEKVKSPWEQAKEYYECSHEQTEICYKTYKNGSIHYFNQCLVCGEAIGTAIPHDQVNDKEIVKPWDDRLLTAYRFAVDEMANQLRAERFESWRLRDTGWDRQYNAYLQTDQWRDKRQRVLERDNYLCQACLKRKAQQVHHLTYSFPLGKEPLFVLVSVCNLCHEAIHELQGGREVSGD